MHASSRSTFFCGIVLTGLGIALGAFGAHWVRHARSPELLEAFRTGVQYQIYHGLALMVLGQSEVKSTVRNGICIGVTLFSGSLYLMALTEVRNLGAVTPFGGIILIGTWCWLAFVFSGTAKQSPRRHSSGKV